MPPELTRLLTYLKITFDRFAPVEDKYFARLKELLIFHQVILAGQQVDRTNFTGFVKQFQSSVMQDPNPDGVPGENTLWAMQQDWAGTRGLKLIRAGIPNDAYQGSHLAFVLRSDVVPFYNSLFQEVHDSGGLVTSSGSLRDLDAEVSAGRSAMSMHYTGIALDVNINSGMAKPATDPFIIERVGTKSWQIWSRATGANGEDKLLNAVHYNPNTNTTSIVATNARVIDFTAAANRHGFARISNRSCFPADYICAEWWHFQCEEVLVPYISQFGAELLTVYTKAQLMAQAPVWASRQKIFKKDWV